MDCPFHCFQRLKQLWWKISWQQHGWLHCNSERTTTDVFFIDSYTHQILHAYSWCVRNVDYSSANIRWNVNMFHNQFVLAAALDSETMSLVTRLSTWVTHDNLKVGHLEGSWWPQTRAYSGSDSSIYLVGVHLAIVAKSRLRNRGWYVNS